MKCSQCQFHFCWLCMVRYIFVVYYVVCCLYIYSTHLYYIHYISKIGRCMDTNEAAMNLI